MGYRKTGKVVYKEQEVQIQFCDECSKDIAGVECYLSITNCYESESSETYRKEFDFCSLSCLHAKLFQKSST